MIDMIIMQADFGTILDMVVRYGATPLMMIFIWWLRGDVKELRKELKVSDQNHKDDLKRHNEELKSFIQNLTQRL